MGAGDQRTLPATAIIAAPREVQPDRRQAMQERDLVGYGANPPHADWPSGARVAVSFVLNVEEGSERAVPRGDPENEPVYDMIDDIRGQPNLTMESTWSP
jgi:hypothetical protein